MLSASHRLTRVLQFFKEIYRAPSQPSLAGETAKEHGLERKGSPRRSCRPPTQKTERWRSAQPECWYSKPSTGATAVGVPCSTYRCVHPNNNTKHDGNVGASPHAIQDSAALLLVSTVQRIPKTQKSKSRRFSLLYFTYTSCCSKFQVRSKIGGTWCIPQKATPCAVHRLHPHIVA